MRFPFGAVDVHLHHGDVTVDERSGPSDHVIECGYVAETTLAFPYRRHLVADPGLALLASRFYDI